MGATLTVDNEVNMYSNKQILLIAKIINLVVLAKFNSN